MYKFVAGGLIVTLMVLTVWANIPHSSGTANASMQLNGSIMDAYFGGGVFACILAIAGGVKAVLALISGGATALGTFWLSAAIFGILEAC
ncbi:MAG TPA: hypothetical protein ENN22_13905 [bacterium]|nr:hypothetical protein [bacterium]